MGGFNLQQLMSQAKQQYEALQKKMQETVVEASSGGGTVSIRMDGRKQLLSLRIAEWGCPGSDNCSGWRAGFSERTVVRVNRE